MGNRNERCGSWDGETVASQVVPRVPRLLPSSTFHFFSECSWPEVVCLLYQLLPEVQGGCQKWGKCCIWFLNWFWQSAWEFLLCSYFSSSILLWWTPFHSERENDRILKLRNKPGHFSPPGLPQWVKGRSCTSLKCMLSICSCEIKQFQMSLAFLVEIQHWLQSKVKSFAFPFLKSILAGMWMVWMNSADLLRLCTLAIWQPGPSVVSVSVEIQVSVAVNLKWSISREDKAVLFKLYISFRRHRWVHMFTLEMLTFSSTVVYGRHSSYLFLKLPHRCYKKFCLQCRRRVDG